MKGNKRSILELVQDHIRGLEPYTPGFQPSGSGWIKLNTNELPYAPPESVLRGISEEIPFLARYPNPTSSGLRNVLAEFHNLHAEQVIVGNGSDDLLNLLARAFGGRDRKTLETYPSYSLYPILTAIAGGEMHSIQFNTNFELPVEELLQSKSDLLFLTNPNAPTGVRFRNEQLRRLAENFDGILVIDEAYAEFASESALPLLREFDRLIITRTFSKAYGLAGLRVGYAMGSAEIIRILDSIRDSYNVNRLSQAGAIAAVREKDHYLSIIEEIKTTRELTRNRLLEFGWKVYPSETNFLFARPVNSQGESGANVASGLFDYLVEKKILVRYFAKHPLTEAFLRISIGTSSEMERLIEEIQSWQRNA